VLQVLELFLVEAEGFARQFKFVLSGGFKLFWRLIPPVHPRGFAGLFRVVGIFIFTCPRKCVVHTAVWVLVLDDDALRSGLSRNVCIQFEDTIQKLRQHKRTLVGRGEYEVIAP